MLGCLGDPGHGLYGFQGICAAGSLAREHDGGCSVIDGIGNVRCLGAGRAGIVHHGIQHLGGGDNDLAAHFGQVNDVFLIDRNFLQGDFDTEVSAGDHDAVGDIEDLTDIVDALGALNLGNDLHPAVVSLEDLADLKDIIGSSGKGSRDIFVTQFASEFNIRPVLFTDKRHGQVSVRYIDALVVGDRSAVDNGTVYLRFRDAVDPQFDQAVVDQDHSALGDIFGQIFVADRRALRSSHHFFGRQCEITAFFQHDPASLKVPEADLGSLGVHQCGNRNAHLSAEAYKAFEFFFVLLMSTVGEIKSCHVHAGVDQLTQHLFTLTGRSDCADDFCFAHMIPLRSSYMFLKACYDRRCGLPASIFSASIPLIELLESVRYTRQYFINVVYVENQFYYKRCERI